ncbi:ferredoxin [Mycobacterium sp.]|uniref:ferredoxin n=1 Tax=Mycobacterium sp. TaxID=1785 RepID=UPI002CB8022F|nr:ferredoxin [Mycobacterium sp.]HKP42730.1 ferredoxin [Mycobacterium sp.]
MKALVDSTKCNAYGSCAQLCPSVFGLDDWGYASVVGDGTFAEADLEAVRQAVGACPENAISIEE